MKRFDLSEIMRNAHRTYKYSGKKQGKNFWRGSESYLETC